MITDHITSEDPAHHWSLLDVSGGIVLDLGCGYNDDEARERQWSTPQYWYMRGAVGVIGIDASAEDVKRIRSETPGTYLVGLVSVEIVETLMGLVTHIKSDCEGGEASLFAVPIQDNVRAVSVECHTPELADICRRWVAAGGLQIVAEQPLHHHTHIVVITAVRP